MSARDDIRVGDDVKVFSGPHEGRAGRLTQVRDISLDGRDPEPYGIVAIAERNCFDEITHDHISVPLRRCTRIRS